METTPLPPTPDGAAAALAEADAGRAALAGSIAVPSWFFTSVGVAVAAQIATAALGIAEVGRWAAASAVAGAVALVAVAVVQLTRFRRLNGATVAGIPHRVLGGTATAAAVSYPLALGGAIWSAFSGRWWLIAAFAAAGGVAYALSGRAWLRRYRSDPAAHSRGRSPLWWAIATALAAAGMLLLVLEH